MSHPRRPESLSVEVVCFIYDFRAVIYQILNKKSWNVLSCFAYIWLLSLSVSVCLFLSVCLCLSLSLSLSLSHTHTHTRTHAHTYARTHIYIFWRAYGLSTDSVLVKTNSHLLRPITSLLPAFGAMVGQTPSNPPLLPSYFLTYITSSSTWNHFTHPEDRGSVFLLNVGTFNHYRVQKHRRRPPFDHSCCKNLKIYALNFSDINSKHCHFYYIRNCWCNSISKLMCRSLVSLCAKFRELVPVPVVH